MIRTYKIDPKTTLPGLREIEERDVPEVADLFARYMERFAMVPLMTVDEVRHQFLSGRGELDQPSENNRRSKQVVWTYVVEVRGVARPSVDFMPQPDVWNRILKRTA
jgi:glycylpeptide N-tetradecanoyltransferase